MARIFAFRDHIHNSREGPFLSDRVRELFENDDHAPIHGVSLQIKSTETRRVENLTAVYSYCPLWVEGKEVKYHSQFRTGGEYVALLPPQTVYSLGETKSEVTTIIHEIPIPLSGFRGWKGMFRPAYFQSRNLYDLVWSSLIEMEEVVQDHFGRFDSGEEYEDPELYQLLMSKSTSGREKEWSVSYRTQGKRWSGVLSSAQLSIPEAQDLIITPLPSRQELLARRREKIRLLRFELIGRYTQFLKTERKFNLEKAEKTEEEFCVLVQPRSSPNPVDMERRDYNLYQQLNEKYHLVYLPCVVALRDFREVEGLENDFPEQSKMFLIGDLSLYGETRLIGVILCKKR